MLGTSESHSHCLRINTLALAHTPIATSLHKMVLHLRTRGIQTQKAWHRYLLFELRSGRLGPRFAIVPSATSRYGGPAVSSGIPVASLPTGVCAGSPDVPGVKRAPSKIPPPHWPLGAGTPECVGAGAASRRASEVSATAWLRAQPQVTTTCPSIRHHRIDVASKSSSLLPGAVTCLACRHQQRNSQTCLSRVQSIQIKVSATCVGSCKVIGWGPYGYPSARQYP
ncbi:hypothetical protein C8Q72DRAFT_94319 [Fomitopsis betulina]|nr:hypothetical protein C8Q72DRAFT_648588 [Fomitopsis betulina]KAI0732650.1 hypothetical protein C8Q72DRAFT_94319 [Fomitopsis betulina]